LESRRERVDFLGQLKNLPGDSQKLVVLLILLLDHLPLLICDHLSLGVGAVLADHHERGQKARFQRNDRREQAERVFSTPG
jgi:hypothetical protein